MKNRNPLTRACVGVLAIGAAAITLLPTATHAQTNIWHDDFDQQPVGANSDDGSYGAVAFNFTGAGIGHPLVMITNDLPDTLTGDPSYTHTNNCAFLIDTDPADFSQTLNFGWRINRIPVIGGNTNLSLRAYNLNFDIAVSGGTSINGIGGYVAPSIGIYGNQGGEYYSFGCQSNVPTAFFPPAGLGYIHYSVNLASFGTANATLLSPTNSLFSFFIAFYMAGHTYPGIVEIDLANISITMSNPPPPPPPTMTLVPAKPGLRVFAQDHTQTYNQEGFGTVDLNQSWVGVATQANPVSYSITFADFDTVNNYTLYAQFLQNGNRSEEHTSELQSRQNLVCRLLLEKNTAPDGPLFPTQPGVRRSRDAVERRVTKHAATAQAACPSINFYNVTPHPPRPTPSPSPPLSG